MKIVIGGVVAAGLSVGALGCAAPREQARNLASKLDCASTRDALQRLAGATHLVVWSGPEDTIGYLFMEYSNEVVSVHFDAKGIVSVVRVFTLSTAEREQQVMLVPANAEVALACGAQNN